MDATLNTSSKVTLKVKKLKYTKVGTIATMVDTQE